MSILAGYGKSKKDKNGKTYISGFFTEEFLKLCPQLNGLLINMKYIPREQRKTEKSPHWAIELFCPQDSAPKTAEPEIPNEDLIREEEIPFDQPPV